jgi:predicted enzyme related to lactoylglutathione lyase
MTETNSSGSSLPPNPGWFDISTPDAARATQFYQEMFGWQINALDDNYSMIAQEGNPPAGGIGQAGPSSPYTGLVVYFPVDDVVTALDRAEKLGGRRVMEPQPTPMGRIAAFADPDGNCVGLQSP